MIGASRTCECSALIAIARRRRSPAETFAGRIKMRRVHDWEAVQRRYDEAHDPEACRAYFHITYGAWAMAVRRGKLRLESGKRDSRRRHDWSMVQSYYDEGCSMLACMQRFRFCRGAWHKAVKRGEIKPRRLGRSLSELCSVGRSRSNLKRRLLRAGLLASRCDECGLTEWLGERLTIQIDHVNGIRDDHRLDNLRMLCPNCHSQTVTYGRRGAKRPGLLQEEAAPV